MQLSEQFGRLASDRTIEKTISALTVNGIAATVAQDGKEAIEDRISMTIVNPAPRLYPAPRLGLYPRLPWGWVKEKLGFKTPWLLLDAIHWRWTHGGK